MAVPIKKRNILSDERDSWWGGAELLPFNCCRFFIETALFTLVL